MDKQAGMHEPLSALADGELTFGELELAYALLDTAAGRAAWDRYQKIGALLRSDAGAAKLSPEFQSRLAQRLAAEAPLELASDAPRAAPVAPIIR